MHEWLSWSELRLNDLFPGYLSSALTRKALIASCPGPLLQAASVKLLADVSGLLRIFVVEGLLVQVLKVNLPFLLGPLLIFVPTVLPQRRNDGECLW